MEQKFIKYWISLNVGALSWNVNVISFMSNIAVILNLVLNTFLCKFDFLLYLHQSSSLQL
jgi:hypothetical protein